MYRKYPALYANDCGYEGFQWINANDGDRSIYSFVRWSPTGKNNLLFVCNFTPVERPDYMCGVPRKNSTAWYSTAPTSNTAARPKNAR